MLKYLPIVCICYLTFGSNLAIGEEQADERIEWPSGSTTYVFLKSVSPVDRIAADAACKNAGLKLIQSDKDISNCKDRSDLFKCARYLAEPFIDITAKLAKSPIWSALPLISHKSNKLKAIWYSPDYDWTFPDGEKVQFRFRASQKILPQEDAPEIFGVTFDHSGDDYESFRASVVCKK